MILLIFGAMLCSQTSSVFSQAQRNSPAPLGRANADRFDDSDSFQVHVIYTVPKDGQDRQRDTNGEIRNSILALQSWFKGQTGGVGLRFDTYDGEPDITFVRLSQTDAELSSAGEYALERIEAELTALGFNHPRKLYAVYHDGGNNHTCGGGAAPPSLVGSAGITFLRGTPPGAPPCSNSPLGASLTQPSYLDYVMLHEVVHTLGAVPDCAPHLTSVGHHTTDDPADLMYGGNLPARSPRKLDANHDDYFGHGRSDCFDLAKSAFLEPLPVDAAPPLGWPMLPLSDLGCTQLGSLRSGLGNPTKLRFVSVRREPVDVFWVDSTGKQVQGGVIQPFGRVSVNTLSTSVFVVKNKAGLCLGVFRTGEVLAGLGVAVVR